MRAYFEPRSHANKFISINQNALKNMGYEIFKLNAMLSIKTAWENRHKALVVMNWVEDQMYRKDATMLSTMYLFMRYQFFLLLSLIFCKHKIWIRHNFVPHNASGNLVLFKLMVWSLKLYNYREVYLEDYIGSQHLIHPLYESDEEILQKADNKKTVDVKSEITTLLFGSIKPYKGVDKLLQTWPKNLKLTILGSCSDESYTNTLNAIIKSRNITVNWLNEFISDNLLGKSLSDAHFIVMAHKNESMVSSGSFYHALTFGCNVLTSESAFSNHKAKQHDFVHLVNFKELDEQTLANIWIEKKDVIARILPSYGRRTLEMSWKELLSTK